MCSAVEKTSDLPTVIRRGFLWPGQQAGSIRRRGQGGVCGGGSQAPGPLPGPWRPPGWGKTLPCLWDASQLLSVAASLSLQSPAHLELSPAPLHCRASAESCVNKPGAVALHPGPGGQAG